MNRLTSLSIVTALVTLAALPNHARAQVVYDNGFYIGSVGARDITSVATADDFTVSSSLTFNAIRFYAVDTDLGLLPNFSGRLTWFLYSGSAGSPVPNAIPSTTIIAQGTTRSITITDTRSFVLSDPLLRIAQLDFDIPTQTLGAGTYWLRLKEGTASSVVDANPIFWVQTTRLSTGNGFRVDHHPVNPTTWDAAGTSTNRDLAFQLLNKSVTAPEPGTLALGALGSIALLALRRRKNI